MGINPSTAALNTPDPTIKRVRRFAANNGYDGWTMLNVYPQIATDTVLQPFDTGEYLRTSF